MKKFRTFIANFFRSDAKESMMRLVTLLLVLGGIGVIYMAVALKLDGAHYGLELAILGVIGKSYQKGIEDRKNNNQNQ